MIGRTVSHFRILAKLGEGGMGVVYRAEDLKLERAVALKFLPLELTCDETAKARFVREARAASSLEHPNICAIHAIDETPNGQLFIVMPCYDGESLQAKLERGPLPLEAAADIASQVSAGLVKAHEKGIVHRDIKPGNILVTGDGVVKIVDFGIAKLGGKSRLTRTGAAPGTVSYMAPEQIRGGSVDHRADIWALGVVLYEMVTGQAPFGAEYEQAISYAIVNEAPQPARSMRPDVPAALAHVVEKALAKDPDERFQNAAELLGALRSLQGRAAAPSGGRADGGGAGAGDVPSIAVLPFANMSPDPENQYFGDGLAEELINALTQIEGLHVAARTSAFRFRGEGIDIREIGEKLNVGTVLEGSVRRAGDRVRVTAQLIDIGTGYHLWSQRFDREMRDIFEIQDEIARAIVEQLRVELVGAGSRSLVTSCTDNLDAYSVFLEARYHWNSLTPEGWARSLELYEKAIALDPSFALAHAWLAMHYGSRSFWGNEAPRDMLPRAQAIAERALELDDRLAVAHGQMANAFWIFHWDFPAAEREFRRALAMDPGSALGRVTFALFLACRGRKEEALREASLGLKLDPLSSLVAAWAAAAYNGVGEAEPAIDICRKALALDSGHWQLSWHLGVAYLRAQMMDAAVAVWEKAAELSGGASAALALLAVAYDLTGRTREADRLRGQLVERSREVYVAPYLFACMCIVRGEREAAVAHLERGVRERDSWLDFISTLPPQMHMSGPEVDAVLRKAGLR